MDFLALGDITVDAFIKLSDAWVETDNPNGAPELCMQLGEKISYQSFTEVAGVGNSPNASVSAARLGLHSALVSNLGADENGKKCLAALAVEGVDIEQVTIHRRARTNYHFVLSFGAERTILVRHETYPRVLPAIEPAPRWLYLSSLGAGTEAYHKEIAAWLEENPETKLVFQPGSFQIAASGTPVMEKLYARAEVLVCNVEEAVRILEKQSSLSGSVERKLGRRDGAGQRKSSTEDFRVPRDTSRIRTLLSGLHYISPRIVCITDGPKGAYMLDESGAYFMPPYPDPKPPINRTGAGDAFASTLVSYLALGKTPLEALWRAPVNSAFVVQQTGAQKGLLTREKLEKYLAIAPKEYEPRLL